MRAHARRLCWLVVLAVALLFSGETFAQTTIADVAQALQTLGLSSGEVILQAFKLGFSQGRLYPEEALRLVTRLAAAEGSPADKEAIVLTLASALMDDLPVTMLVSKVAEGLARGVPLPQIGQGITQGKRLHAQVRDLLFAKGIFVVKEGQTTSAFLPPERFDLLVSHIADALGEYLEGGGSPLDGYLLEQAVGQRLSKLKGAVIPGEDVDLALTRLSPSDLTRVVLAVLD